jgi:hypothetical protein
MSDKADLSILVISCDSYADAWPPFFSLFWQYWPDCPYPVFLGANQKGFSDPKVHSLMAGQDTGWSHSVRRMMEHLDGKYVLVLLEDFFFFRAVDTAHIASLFSSLVNLNGAYLRLKPFPRPDRTIPAYPNIGLIEPGAPYRVALQAAIWKKDVFLRLLKPGETPWQMELRGTVRSEHIPDTFYSVWKPALHYQAGITIGKWTPSALRRLKRENILLDLSARPVMTFDEALRRVASRGMNRVLNSIPWKIRRVIGNVLRNYGLLPAREG